MLWSDLPLPLISVIEESTPGLIHGEQAVANTIWALGNMNINLNTLTSPEMRINIEKAFVHVSGSFTSQGFSNSLYGLSKMGFFYHSKNDPFYTTNNSNNNKDLKTTNIITETKTNNHENKFPLTAEMINSIITACTDTSKNSCFGRMNDQVLSNVLWSLGSMQFQLHDINEGDNYRNINAKGRNINLHSSVSSTNSNTKNNLANNIAVNDNNKVSFKSSVSLPKMSYIPYDTILTALDRCLLSMTEQGLSMSLWGLAKVCRMKCNLLL